MRVLASLPSFCSPWASPASGQSLAAVARKEEARRKEVKQSSRVITNKDLRPVRSATAAPRQLAAPAPATPRPPEADKPPPMRGRAARSRTSRPGARRWPTRVWRSSAARCTPTRCRARSTRSGPTSRRATTRHSAPRSSSSASAPSPSRTASKARSRPRRRPSPTSRKRPARPACPRLDSIRRACFPFCSSRTRTRCARCSAPRSKTRATSSSRPATRPKPLARLHDSRPDLVLSDLRLTTGDGLGVLRAAKDLDPDLPVIVMTAYGSIQDAVLAMKEGALDFLAKPVDLDHLQLLVARALCAAATGGREPAAQGRARRASRRADHHRRRPGTEARVRVAGARRGNRHDGAAARRKRHRQGVVRAHAARAEPPRQRARLSPSTAPRFPETLLETELFGHEKGAFTGATARKPGRFELAHRGTLFLDEIGDLPLALQAKILRALEEKRFERVGGTQSLQVDVRVVAATNRQLKAAVAARQFREDLFFRLSVFPIEIPPLRERGADVETLAHHFIDRFSRDVKKRPLTAVAGRARGAARLSLAGQRARAAELHRARGDPHRRRHDPSAPPEPDVPRRPAPPRRPSIRGRGSICRAVWPTPHAVC